MEPVLECKARVINDSAIGENMYAGYELESN